MTTFDPKPFLANVSQRPGVYRMIGADGEVLYVGKARNLKNRLTTYFVGKAQAAKTMAMVSQIANVEVTVTASETEALLLEYNLIKRHRPRFNVTLRDDKSFPYLYITTQHQYPRISFYRGSRKLPGRFFGPYPNARATRETVLLLQKLFLLRPCSDTFFANRSRPCLQYQIKRCSGPCVRLIPEEHYRQDVADAMKVLEGKGAELIDDLAQRMEQASQQLDFERAARLRDQINGIKAIHSTQSVTRNATEDIDAVALDLARLGSLRFHRIRTRRPQSRQQQFLPAARHRRSRRTAVRIPRAVLPGPRGAGRNSDQPVDRRRRSARSHAVAAHGAQRAHPHRSTRRAGAVAGNGAHERGAGPEHATRHRGDDRRTARCSGRSLQSPGAADAHGMLRREPYDGRANGGVLRRLRRPGTAQERLSALQYRGARAGR